MKLDDLIEQWNNDSIMDTTDLTKESTNTVKLHNKYFPIYIKEGLRLRVLKGEYKQLLVLINEYYKGELSGADLEKNKLEPFNLKLLKTDVLQYVEANDRIINMSLKIGLQESTVNFLESILRQINNRGYIVKNIIDFEKFKAGY